MHLKRWFYWVVGLPLALIGSYFFLFPQVWHCQWLPFSDFRQVQSHFYAAPQLSNNQLNTALNAQRQAQQRIKHLWGGQQGNATIIVCQSWAQYERYCNSTDGAGCSIGTPWGQAFIVLNLEGLNADVLAHEMCHDEVFSRLGWWTTKRQVPQWFNEGLALTTDYRFVTTTDSIQRYLDYKDEMLYRSYGGQMALSLSEIASTQGFFGGNEARQMLAYMTAATEVSRWLALVGRKGVATLTTEIKAGAAFEKVYQQTEQQAKKALLNANQKPKV